MKPAPFAYADPRTPDETLDLLAEFGDDAKILAGGQSLLPLMNFRLARPSVLVDINRVSGLEALSEESNGALRVGAMVRQRTLERWTNARPAWGLLHKALSLIGHAAIRTRGTVGGSLAHADPASELSALLLCHEGTVIARRRDGQRALSAAEFFAGPLTTTLGPDELLVEVHLPALPAGAGWAFEEVTRRHGDFALIGVAAVLTLDPSGTVSDARLALFGVGDTAVRIPASEAVLRGQPPNPAALAEAARRAAEQLDPPSDLQATAMYRRRVARVLSERALAAAAARAAHVGGPA
jgi:aerobic carbon-monoxide dehydrogenase medium subunit